MADKIKIMISSRCKTPIKTDAAPIELSEIRLDLKKKIEALKLSEKEMLTSGYRKILNRPTTPKIHGMSA
jgi:hypothetical protein